MALYTVPCKWSKHGYGLKTSSKTRRSINGNYPATFWRPVVTGSRCSFQFLHVNWLLYIISIATTKVVDGFRTIVSANKQNSWFFLDCSSRNGDWVPKNRWYTIWRVTRGSEYPNLSDRYLNVSMVNLFLMHHIMSISIFVFFTVYSHFWFRWNAYCKYHSGTKMCLVTHFIFYHRDRVKRKRGNKRRVRLSNDIW